MKSRRSMAFPKQSAFHRSTSASTLLLTADLDCMDNTRAHRRVHTHAHTHFLCHCLSHTLIDMQQFSLTPYSFILTFIFACHTHLFQTRMRNTLQWLLLCRYVLFLVGPAQSAPFPISLYYLQTPRHQNCH